jgi:hypothetical protein
MSICELGRPAFADTYAVAGRFICVEARAARTAELFRHYFAGWHVAPLPCVPQDEDASIGRDEDAGVSVDAVISVHTGEEPPDAPSWFETFETAGGGVCHTDGRSYFFRSNGSVVGVGGDTPKRVEVWIGDGGASREREALARLIFDASMTALRRCGLFELHSAGVVEPESGAGILLVGPSGSGKSTLATVVANAGWQYLSDDTLLLYESGHGEFSHGVAARALRREFAVTEPTVAAGLLDGYEDQLSGPVPFDPQKRRFEPQAVFPDRFAESCIPRAVFFPVVTHEPRSRARTLSQAETMRRLIRMCPWACYDRPAAKAHLGVLAGLARQAEGYELQAGRDLIADAAFASDFLRTRARREAL